jgi:hypothetical protein
LSGQRHALARLLGRHGARRFVVGGTFLTTLSMAAMSLATRYCQIAMPAMLSGSPLYN